MKNNKNILWRLSSLLILLFVCVMANAVPARPGQTRQITLSDGTTVSARLVGDEFCHYWLGQDGRAYRSTTDGDVYQAINMQAARQLGATKRNAANKQRAMRLPRKVGTYGNYFGEKRGIVILVNFKDVSFKATQAKFDRIANTVDFQEGDFRGSMYDYFYAQSGGQFKLKFDVVGPYTVSKNRSYYGGNDSGGNDQYPAQMVIEAIKMANADVNFADYDWDGDGYVDQVYVVYAGKGESDGGGANTIWPHAYSLSSAAYYGDGSGKQKLDGVWIDTYACGGELNGNGKTDGIGTMCHEFSHCLGYPDFYDIDYSGGQGMGYWDLMDSGCYNGDGYRPAGYTTYERWMAGWKEPVELTSGKKIEGMKSLQEGGNAYIIYNKGNRNEYFILENRQPTGWDDCLPGKGLLIVHADYDAKVWEENSPNNDPSHQRMTWMAADNNYQYEMYDGTKYYTFEGQANDTYPYGNVNAFGKNTTPAAKLYNKNTDGTYYLDTSVENIKQNADGTISFRYVAPSDMTPPTFTPGGGRYTEPQTVTISCDTEEAAIYYTNDGSDPTTESTLYTEPITISETTTLKAIAVADELESDVTTARYSIVGEGSVTNTFVRVASTDEMVSGMRYIIACAGRSKAAGELNTTYLNPVDVTVETDTITINDQAAVFIIEGDNNNGWSFLNEDTGMYLFSSKDKNVGYTNNGPVMWTLDNGTKGVVMKSLDSGTYCTMLYNALSPRFTTYSSSPTASRIQANLYVEFERNITPEDTIVVDKKDITLAFSATEAEAIIGEDFTAPALIIEPEGTFVEPIFTSSVPQVATVDEDTGKVKIIAPGTTVITATFEGDDYYNPATASYTLTVREIVVPVIVDITMTATKGGSIRLGDEVVSDSTTTIQVQKDSVLTFVIMPEEAYFLKSVTVNDEDMTEQMADSLLTLSDVPDSIAVVATFEKLLFTITATATEGGSIVLSAEQAEWGDSITVTITPEEEYVLESLIVNGTDVTAEVSIQETTDSLVSSAATHILQYIIRDVSSNVEVMAIFRSTVAVITIGQEGMTTYCSSQDLDFTGIKGISAYVACGYIREAPIEGSDTLVCPLVVMLPVTNIPAYEGLVVKGEPGTYKVPCAKSQDYYVNMLIGNVQEADVAPTDGNKTNYFLTDGADGTAFYRVEEEGTLAANSAILQLPTAIDAEGGKLAILFIGQGEDGQGEQGVQGDRCDVNGDGAVNVADIGTIIDAMAAQARMQNIKR